MATSSDFIEYVREQAGLAGRLTIKKIFGEYAVYIHGNVVALVCDNSVFVKPTKALQHLGASLGEGPPYPGAKPYLLADALLDDPGMLRQVLMKTAAEVRAPKARTAR